MWVMSIFLNSGRNWWATQAAWSLREKDSPRFLGETFLRPTQPEASHGLAEGSPQVGWKRWSRRILPLRWDDDDIYIYICIYEYYMSYICINICIFFWYRIYICCSVHISPWHEVNLLSGKLIYPQHGTATLTRRNSLQRAELMTVGSLESLWNRRKVKVKLETTGSFHNVQRLNMKQLDLSW